jgi:hypothetical protein
VEEEGMAVEHEYPRFSDAEFARRHRAMRERMAQADVAVVLAYGSGGAGSQVQYLTNWPVTTEAWLLFPRDGEMAMRVHYYTTRRWRGALRSCPTWAGGAWTARRRWPRN